MRILQVAPPWFSVPPAGYGGTEHVVAGLVDGLVDAGHDVTLLASGGSCTRGRLRSIYADPPSAELGDALVELPHVLEAYRHRLQFDLIHDHTAIGATFASLLAGPPVVHTLHGPWTPATERLYRSIGAGVHLVAVSQDQARRAPRDIELAGVVPNGIELDRYPLGSHDGGYLGFVGRASREKGPEVAVEVARRLGRRLRMAIKVNEAPEIDYWDKMVAPRLQGVDVEVLLSCTHEQKVDLLGGADVVLFPIQWPEPFGLVAVEANATGAPVVAFAEGAAPEVILDGISGVIVPAGDIDAFCAATERAATLDPAACRHAADRYSARNMTTGYLRIYEQLIDGAVTAPLPNGATAEVHRP